MRTRLAIHNSLIYPRENTGSFCDLGQDLARTTRIRRDNQVLVRQFPTQLEQGISWRAQRFRAIEFGITIQTRRATEAPALNWQRITKLLQGGMSWPNSIVDACSWGRPRQVPRPRSHRSLPIRPPAPQRPRPANRCRVGIATRSARSR